MVVCRFDLAPQPLSFRRDGDSLHYDSDYHHRRHGAGTDLDACFGGRIAVTRTALF